MIVTSILSGRKRALVKNAVLSIKNAKPRIVLGLIMSMSMAVILSFVLTLSYTGFSPNYLSVWVHRLALSLAIGPPIALMLLPLAIKLVGTVLREPWRDAQV